MLRDGFLGRSTPATRIVIIAAVMLLGAGYLTRASRAEALPPRKSLAMLPLTIDGWQGQNDPPLSERVVEVLGVDDYTLRTYVKRGQQSIFLYIGYHDSQRQGDTIHSPLNCLPAAGWIPLEQSRITIPVHQASAGPGLTPIEVNQVVIGKGLDRQLVLYWYQSHRRVVASEYWGKIYTVLDSVRYNRTDAAMVRIVTLLPDGTTAADAEPRTKAFIQALFPLLPGYLPS